MVGSLIHHSSKCFCPNWFCRCKEHPYLLSQNWGFCRISEVPDWVLTSIDFNMVTVLHYIYAQNFNSSSCFWRSRKYQGHLSPLSLWYTNVSNFVFQSWFWRWKFHTCPWSPYLGLWRMLEAPEWGLLPLSWFGYGYWSLIHSYSELWLSILILKEQRKSTSFKSWFWALEDAEVPNWFLVHPCSEFWLLICILKVQKTSMSFKSCYGALEDTGCSWLWFCILILILIWSLVFGTPIF